MEAFVLSLTRFFFFSLTKFCLCEKEKKEEEKKEVMSSTSNVYMN